MGRKGKKGIESEMKEIGWERRGSKGSEGNGMGRKRVEGKRKKGRV